MAKVICLFNHKGGVSKTTTAFNLGWMMARKGKRVLLADLDPQCNLTGMVMGFQGADQLEPFYAKSGTGGAPANNIRDGLEPAFEAKPQQIQAAECVKVKGNDNLLLLPGHIGLAEYETTLGIAQELSGSLLTLRNLPGSIRFLLDATARGAGADYVLADMSPSLGPLNQNLLLTSDNFLVPLHPDFFSSMALSSLAGVLPRWKSWAELAYKTEALRTADYPFPEPHAAFVGAIIQKYRPRLGRASKAFQRWIKELTDGLRETLVPALVRARMVDCSRFQALGREPWHPIMEAADFNSLIAWSQDHQVPVYELTKDQIGQSGAVWEQTQKSMEQFDSGFSLCADRVFDLTS